MDFHNADFLIELGILGAFVLAVVILIHQAWGTVAKSLDARAQAIRHQLDEAKRLREEAEAMLAEYQRKQRDAIAEAQEIVTLAQAEAERVARQAEIDLEAAIKRREEQARDKITQAEVKALAEVRGVAVDVAIEAVRVLLAETLDAKRGASLIDQAIEELPKRLH
jgi:F-type H+-transporting ATPase subunit b